MRALCLYVLLDGDVALIDIGASDAVRDLLLFFFFSFV